MMQGPGFTRATLVGESALSPAPSLLPHSTTMKFAASLYIIHTYTVKPMRLWKITSYRVLARMI